MAYELRIDKHYSHASDYNPAAATIRLIVTITTPFVVIIDGKYSKAEDCQHYKEYCSTTIVYYGFLTTPLSATKRFTIVI